MKVTYSHGERQGETVDVSAHEADRLIRGGAAVRATAPEPVKQDEPKTPKPKNEDGK